MKNNNNITANDILNLLDILFPIQEEKPIQKKIPIMQRWTNAKKGIICGMEELHYIVTNAIETIKNQTGQNVILKMTAITPDGIPIDLDINSTVKDSKGYNYTITIDTYTIPNKLKFYDHLPCTIHTAEFLSNQLQKMEANYIIQQWELDQDNQI